jgi:AcrR family transcriptional regulator
MSGGAAAQSGATVAIEAAPGGKHAARKRELAEAALDTLAEFGFARTNLRDIAKASGASLGVLHYYFRDKVDLITYCVALYKRDFVDHLNSATATARTADELRTSFIEGLVGSVREQPKRHRLWYDIRAQSLFDESFRPAMWAIDADIEAMIGAFLARMEQLGGGRSSIEVGTAYALLDGLFQRYLLKHIAGERNACDAFERDLRAVLQTMLG